MLLIVHAGIYAGMWNQQLENLEATEADAKQTEADDAAATSTKATAGAAPPHHHHHHHH